jgi:hypothetical protein
MIKSVAQVERLLWSRRGSNYRKQEIQIQIQGFEPSLFQPVVQRNPSVSRCISRAKSFRSL